MKKKKKKTKKKKKKKKKTCPCNAYRLISKTGDSRGIPIFLISGPKHRLLVFVRTPRWGGPNVYPQSMF